MEAKPRRTPPLERLASLAAEYFEPLGAVVEFAGAILTIDGVEACVKGDASARLDAIGLEKYAPEMQRAARLEIIDQIPGTESQFTDYGLEILQSGQRAALIKVSHATLRGGQQPRITGNFLVGHGLHWDELRRNLGGPSLAVVLSDLPASASAHDRSSAQLVSGRIRDDRSSGWGLDVQIRGDQTGDTIVFSPISDLEAPFQFTSARGDVVRGALRLRTSVGILEIAMIHPPADELLSRAWLFALRTFADLTCGRARTAFGSHEIRLRGGRDRRQPGGEGDREQQPASIPRLRSGELPSQPGMSGRLTPTAATAGVLRGGYYVAAHKTRLPPGRHAHPGPRKSAAALGISLGPNETWRGGHWRGVPGHEPLLEFVWREAEATATTAQAA